MSENADAKNRKAESGRPAPSLDIVKAINFRSFVRQHYALTRGVPAFGICCGILAAPVLSLVKPLLEVPGLVVTVLGILCLGILGRLLHGMGRVWEYYLRRRRELRPDAVSWPARASFFCNCTLLVLVPIVVIECLSPAQGILVTAVPSLADLQNGLLKDDDTQVAKTALPAALEPEGLAPSVEPATFNETVNDDGKTVDDVALTPEPAAASAPEVVNSPAVVAPDPLPAPADPAPEVAAAPREDQPQEAAPPMPAPKPVPDMREAIARGNFVLVSATRAAVVAQSDMDRFQNVHEVVGDEVQSLLDAAGHLRHIGIDPRLTHRFCGETDPEEFASEELARTMRSYWRPQRFIPVEFQEPVDFVAFKVANRKQYEVALLLDRDKNQLNKNQLRCFLVEHGLSTVKRERIETGTAVWGRADNFAKSMREADFLDYCLLRVLLTLNSNRDESDYTAVAVRVDTKRLAAEVETLQDEQRDALDRLAYVKDVAAGPPRYIEGQGLLGTLFAAAFIAAEKEHEISFATPFVNEL